MDINKYILNLSDEEMESDEEDNFGESEIDDEEEEDL